MIRKVVIALGGRNAAPCIPTLALAAAMASAAWAQSLEAGRITGRVTDLSGGVLPGVQLTLTADGIRRSAVTDSEGRFAFEDLPADTAYAVHAQLPGFREATRDGLVVRAGETVATDFSLKVGCLAEVAYVVDLPLDQLLTADAVVHVRIAEDSRYVRIETEDCPITSHQASATILQVAASSRGEWRAGATVQLASAERLTAGTEYLAFLNYSERLQRLSLGGPYIAMKVVGGHVAWFEDEELGFRGNTRIDRALARIRETYTRHTRYRPHGARGAEAPLEALRYKTGWFEMGALRNDRDEWIEFTPAGISIADRPFDFVQDRESSRQLPRRGDRIRLNKGGPITILNFGSRGEALRHRRPTTWKSEAYAVNLTGTRVDVGGVYTVADVVVQPIDETMRFLWVRLVVSNTVK